MIPGELLVEDGDIVLNEGRATITLHVANSGDRPIQVGSHYHFYEVNPALVFERENTRGFHLNIVSGTAVRFEPGQDRKVELVAYAGKGEIYGFRGEIMGPLNGDENQKGGEQSALLRAPRAWTHPPHLSRESVAGVGPVLRRMATRHAGAERAHRTTGHPRPHPAHELHEAQGEVLGADPVPLVRPRRGELRRRQGSVHCAGGFHAILRHLPRPDELGHQSWLARRARAPELPDLRRAGPSPRSAREDGAGS